MQRKCTTFSTQKGCKSFGLKRLKRVAIFGAQKFLHTNCPTNWQEIREPTKNSWPILPGHKIATIADNDNKMAGNSQRLSQGALLVSAWPAVRRNCEWQQTNYANVF